MHGCAKHQTTQQAPQIPLIVIGVACVCVVLRGSFGDDQDFNDDYYIPGGDAPQTISHVSSTPDAVSFAQPRALRGCGGPPTEFRWIFPDGVATEAGSVFRTRLVALDARGYPAKVADVMSLRLNVSLTGRARLSALTRDLVWQGSEVEVDIEDNAAELVDVEVRIEASNQQGLLYSSQVRFTPGPASSFGFLLRPIGSNSTTGVPRQDTVGLAMLDSATRGVWPTEAVLEAVLSATDAFGNAIDFSSRRGGDPTWKFMTLRSSATAVKVLSFFKPNDRGEAMALIRGTRPASSEVWLEQDDGGGGGALRDQTVQRLEFVGPVADSPRDGSRAISENLSPDDLKWQPMAREVREAFLHGWQGYKKYAWGADELKPLSKKGHDSFGNMAITILDSLTTLWIMDLPSEFEEAADFVRTKLDFNKVNRPVSVFEVIIRALGGLLGAHALSGRDIFIQKARDLADRLLPALNTSSGMPLPRCDVARGRGSPSEEPTILAEAGSLQLEFRQLSALTGDLRYRDAADRAFNAIRGTGVTGLVPIRLSPPDVFPTTAYMSNFQVGALGDSYYEYLLKQWVQSSSETPFKKMFLEFMDELPNLVRPVMKQGKAMPQRIRLVDLTGDGEAVMKMDHLSCFVPGMIALGLRTLPVEDLLQKNRNKTWTELAKGVMESCVEMWTSTKSGLASEYVTLNAKSPHEISSTSQAAYSLLRPETVESLFYLYRLTGKSRYREYGKKIFEAIKKHAKVDAGFASVSNVNEVPTKKVDEMQSFVLAETFKYLYLLFSPQEALDLDRFVLNTEGHPLTRLQFGLVT